jgi:sulfite dehydrogenase (quinone) subunit SoeC
MHPALSVIFFTTLSGAGYGLLFWAACAALGGHVATRPLLVSIALAIVLSTVGLVSSLFHLGKPARAWRAFSQWRTSWLSREGVASMVTFLVAVLLAAALLPGMLAADAQGTPVRLSITGVAVAVLAMACAIATVACTAMIYASLKPIPAWRHRLVLPAYLLYALFTGGLLFAAIEAAAGGRLENRPAMLAVWAAIALWLLKRRYWSAIDVPLPATRGDAVGLPQRSVGVFERPHTEANYLTREMGFVVARRHSRALRLASMVLTAMLPIALLLPAWLFVHLDTTPWYAAAALCALAGAFVERWLFFAEAKHMVTLYY